MQPLITSKQVKTFSFDPIVTTFNFIRIPASRIPGVRKWCDSDPDFGDSRGVAWECGAPLTISPEKNIERLRQGATRQSAVRKLGLACGFGD